MLKLEILNKEQELLFINNYKKEIVFKKDKILINKKDKLFAKQIIRKFKIDGKIIERKLNKKKLLINAIFILTIIAFLIVFQNVESEKIVQINCENFEVKSKVENFINTLDYPITKENILKTKIAILNKFEEIAFVEIEIKNNNVIIDIINVTINEPLINNAEKIYAKCDGIVTKIDLKSGSCKVKVGDVVKKGDILIDGYIEKGENELIATNATGSVYAKTYLKESFKICKNQLKPIFTGKTHKKIKGIYNKECPFDYYDKKIEKKKFFLFTFLVETYYEKLICEEILEKEDIQKIALNEITQKRLDISTYATLTDYRFDQKYLDNFYYLDIYYEIEQCISIAGGKL